MPPAPAVQNLNDLITQYTNAEAPQQSQLDQEVNANEQSGAGQVAGLDAAKSNAFGGIEQGASNKGMYFSGFAPDAQAKYVGATYLPALANLNSKIAGVRDTLMGKKADLVSAANSNAITTQKQEQAALDSWNSARAAESFTANQNAQNRANTLAAAGIRSGAGTSPGTPGTDVVNAFKSFIGKGGKLSASNTSNNRNAQDAFLKTWMLDNGIVDPGAQNQIWGLINQSFGRTNDPTKDWTYKAR